MFFENLLGVHHKKRPKVAVISPFGIGAHGDMVGRFVEMNEAHLEPFIVEVYYTRGLSRENIATYLERILKLEYDLLVTVGLRVTGIAYDYISESSLTIPHLFVGVNDCVERGFIASYECSENTSVGVIYEEFETEKALSFLYDCKPTMQRVLIPALQVGPDHEVLRHSQYDRKWLFEEYERAEAYLQTINVPAQIVAMDSVEKLLAYTRSHVHRYDSVIVLEGSTEIAYAIAVSPFCSQAGLTLFSGSRDLVRSAAAVGFGTQFGLLGEMAFEYAVKILSEGRRPAMLPTYRVANSRHGAVNRDLLSVQGVSASHALATCALWRGEVYGYGPE